LLDYDGEQYMTVSEVAKRFKVSRGTCSNNILPALKECYLPGRKNALYRLSDVEQVSQVRVVESKIQPLSLVKQDHDVAHVEDNLRREAL